MEEWFHLGNELRRLVNPETFPVAVKLTTDDSGVPPSARRPLRHLKVKMAPCQGTAMARRYGWTVAFGREDVGCAIAAHTYGWQEEINEAAALDFFTRMNYVCDAEAGREAISGFRRLNLGTDITVIYSPLERTKVEPDVIAIFANPAQMMRLLHGATHHRGTPIESRFSGRAGSCTEGIIGAFLDKTPKLVVPGNGDRVWASCQDHEMMMAIPAEKLGEIVEGLDKTHQKGIRYPIPTYIRYQPEVAFSLPLSDIFTPQERTGD